MDCQRFLKSELYPDPRCLTVNKEQNKQNLRTYSNNKGNHPSTLRPRSGLRGNRGDCPVHYPKDRPKCV